MTLVCLVICVISLFKLATHRQGPVLIGLKSIIVWLMLLLVSSLLALITDDHGSTRFFHIITYGLHGSFTPLVLFTAQRYNQAQYDWVRKYFALFYLIPAISLFLVAYQPTSYLIWSSVSFTDVSVGTFMQPRFGRLFWWVYAYNYALMVLAYSIVSSKYLASGKLYGKHLLVVFAGLTIAALGNIAYSFKLIPGLRQDFTAITMVLGCAIFVFTTLRTNVVDLVPIAREVVFDHMNEGFIVLNRRGLVVDYNRPVSSLLRTEENFIGQPLDVFIPELVNWESHLENDRSYEIELVRDDSRTIEVSRENLLSAGTENIGTLITLRDITEMAKLRKDLEILAISDPLTNLSNRRYFLQQGELAVAQANRHMLQLSLLMLDIDHFKQVNDTYGHKVGDEILVAVTQEISKSIRIVDTFSRFGGEEFMILLPFTAKDEAIHTAGRILRIVHDTQFVTSAGLLHIKLSLGVSTFAAGADDDLDALINRADNGLYFAKHNGRNRLCFYDDLTDPAVVECVTYDDITRTASVEQESA